MQINVVSISPLTDAQKERLKSLGDLKYYDAVLEDPELERKIKGAEILMISPRLHVDILDLLGTPGVPSTLGVLSTPRCKLITVQATGYDAIDTKKARKMGITVCNVPIYGPESIAEHNIALMLAVARKITHGNSLIRNNKWKTGLAYTSLPLTGKTLGLFGFGKNAQAMIKMVKGFDMKIISNTAHPDKKREQKHGIKFVDFETLLKDSDFIVLAAPATKETQNRFTTKEFKQMKKTAIFINTARGALINEHDLAQALNSNEIAGAGIDVYQEEPPKPNNPLFKAKNCILTPHTAWSSENAVNKLNDICIDNIEAFLKGRPQNVVN